jgi:hypothetical protein
MANQDPKNLIQILDERFNQQEQRLSKVIDEKINGSEKRLTDAIQTEGKAVRQEIGDFIYQNLLPQLGEKADKSDIDKLERKVDNFTVRNMENSSRLDKIENLPAIAHELTAIKP